MRTLILLAAGLVIWNPGMAQVPPPDNFARLQALAGEWEADLPGFGKMTNSIRLVSNGKAIEETIGTAADNEVSLYTRDRDRILLTHFCAMTPEGHQAAMLTGPVVGGKEAGGRPDNLLFTLVRTVNLSSPAAPHMRQVQLKFIDNNHFEEKWTKVENGKDTVFDLKFVRR